MSEREPWMPSDDQIARVLPNKPLYESWGEEFDPDELSEPIRSLIRSAVERALAAQEARHKRELIEARIHELNLNGCRAETPTLRRLEDLRAELADLEDKP